jgi:hypothetical protein
MRFTNQTGLPASWTLGFQRDGRELLVTIVKATYRLPVSGCEPVLSSQQVPLVEADRFTGEPGMSAPMLETDYAHRKPACDVLLLGHAHAPPGQQATRVRVGLKVGQLVKQFDVVGERRWRRYAGVVVATRPEPFERIAITYDVAFGGTDRTEEAQYGRSDAYALNPVGVGYGRHAGWIDGHPLPRTEQIGHPVDEPTGKYEPMAFSPIGRNWLPRRSYAGTYDQTWIETTAPLWPEDFDERYFQAAPSEQRIPFPRGGEPVVLQNLTADGERRFSLPIKPMPILFIPHRGRDVVRNAEIDTIVFEPDEERFTMAWRVALPLGKSIFDVKETVIGDMSAAWHRARRSPGKTYYRSLAEAVNAHRSKRQK